ncbi:hypothetical protein LIER_34468 [Lithospermum erythrorhizon]|uniref:Uncharacterized protein n=1 Tax=Lithospermum erythrorhizon TaxID=34254 RepID=A0AAV3S1X5_LITER
MMRVDWKSSVEMLSSLSIFRGHPSAELSSKSQHQVEAVGTMLATLQQFKDRVARLGQELYTHVEVLRRQVATRESVITGLEAGKAESALKVTSLDEIVEHDQGSRSEQLGIELEDFLQRL